jgi:hypothetical protein
LAAAATAPHPLCINILLSRTAGVVTPPSAEKGDVCRLNERATSASSRMLRKPVFGERIGAAVAISS